MDFRILGPLSIREGGEEHRLRGTTQRAVLAVLLLRANRVVSTDALMDELWGEEPPDTATKIIHNAVSQLRRTLGPSERLVTHAPGYLLRVDDGELDADRFQRLAADGRRALDDGRPGEASNLLVEALGLWDGQALADVALEGPAQTEAARLDELRLTAVEDRNEAELALGRHRELVPELEALVAEHPLRERLVAQLVLALYRSGRQADALDAYRRARRFFVDELGLEPSPPLQRLEQAVLQHDPALELGQPPPVERVVVEQAPPRELRKTVTVLVADVLLHGDGLDPESIRPVAERARTLAAAALERHGASVELPAAGELVGIFGLPRANEDDALRAARAAVELRDAVRSLDDELARGGRLRVEARVGIHTGEVLAPASGARVPLAGDAVALAARLAQSADPGEILLALSSERLLRTAAVVERDEGGEARLVSVSAGADAIPRVLDRPLVGRGHELEQLHRALARAETDRHAYLFTILGPAGIGKSRLAVEFAERVADEATVLAGRCLPYGEGITFWPLAEVVRAAAGGLTREAILRVVEGLPEAELVADRVAAAVGLGGAAGSPEETFWAARKLLEAVADERPLVVVFDDLHWAEPTFLDLIEHIADVARTSPILIVCLARPELVEERRWWAGGKLNATSLLLEPLTVTESEALIENLPGGADVPADVRLRAAEAAEGNPLYLEQLMVMVFEEGASLQEVAVPPTIHLLLEARLDRLPEDERAVAERASVVGREFWPNALLALMPDVQRTDLDRRLEQLVRRELVRPSRSAFQETEAFRFRHTLIRETAYRSVPKEVRAELHERFADWLEASDETPAPELVGIHLEQAFRYRSELGHVDERTRTLARRAAERLGSAGSRALSVGDMPAALRLLTRAERLLGDDEDRARDRIELLLDLVDALRETGDFRRARSVLSEVAAAGQTARDEVIAAHALVSGAQLDLQTDPGMRIAEIVSAADAAIGVFERSRDEANLARAWRLRGNALWFRCRAGDAETALTNAIGFARAVGDRRTEAQALNHAVAAAFYGPTPISDAVELCTEILEQPGGQPRIRASALRALAGMRALTGDFDEARVLLADSRAILEDLGLRLTAAAIAETSAGVELLAGDPAAAERELRAGHARLTQMGRTSSLAVLSAMLAQALVAQDRADEALGFSEESERTAGRDDLGSQVVWRAARARVLARLGRVEEADELSGDAVTLAATTDFLVVRGDALLDRAEILLAAARPRDAESTAREALLLYEQKGASIPAERARALGVAASSKE